MKNMKKAVLVLLACPLFTQAAGAVDLSSLDFGNGDVNVFNNTYSGGCAETESYIKTFWPTPGAIRIMTRSIGSSTIYMDIETKPEWGLPNALCHAGDLQYVSGNSSSGFNFKGNAQCESADKVIRGLAAMTVTSLRKSAQGYLLGKITMNFMHSDGSVFCTATGQLD